MPGGLIKTDAEIELMAEAGRRLAYVLKELRKAVRPGIATNDLEKKARQLLKEVDAKSAFLNYRPYGALKPYPAALCVSVNDAVVHGLPSDYVIKGGDLVSIDMGLIHEGFYSDSAITVGAGPVSKDAARLIRATDEALSAGIKQAKPGNTLGDIGFAVSARVEKEGFAVVETLTGHGIGRELHEDPYVFNVGKKGEGEKLKPGMVIAIEPMVSMGSGRVKQLKDDSFATRDGSLAAHFEHTVAITKNGPRVLTL